VSTPSGYSLPLSPGGTASLVPAPPWHYVGDFLVIEYWADPAAVAALLPPGLEPHADPGRCAALFVDWQSCSDAGDELIDPIRGQYKEFFIVVNAMLDGEDVTSCPYIWVDKDFALLRGWVQGFPKKLARIDMTRSFGLDCRAEGRTFAGTVSANGHRVAQGTVTPERVSESGPTHNDPPLVNRRHFPRLAAGRHSDPAVHELVRARSRDRSISAIHEGPATLELFRAPAEEHSALAPVRMGKGFRFQFAYTVDDLETVRDLRHGEGPGPAAAGPGPGGRP
jgi:acetoacetate decarboxylase